MNISAEVDQVQEELRSRGKPERAVFEKGYLKSELEFLGVPVPEIRKAARRVRARHKDMPRKALLSLVGELWSRDVHELRSVGVGMLELFLDRLEVEDLRFLEDLLRRKSQSWAYVDWIAIKVAGPLISGNPGQKRILERWARDDNFWLRRSSMLALYADLRAGGGDWALFCSYARALMEEKEFFIRKAIGWVCRDVSKKRPELVYEFLLEEAHRASGLTLREGTKYLPTDQREEILAVYRSK